MTVRATTRAAPTASARTAGLSRSIAYHVAATTTMTPAAARAVRDRDNQSPVPVALAANAQATRCHPFDRNVMASARQRTIAK